MQVINAIIESDLSERKRHGHPIAGNMIKVVQINPTYCQSAQLIQGRGGPDVRKRGRFRHKREWNKPGESGGFVLQFSKLAEVVDPMFNRLNVTKQHSGGAALTHSMPYPMNLLPLLGRFLTATNLVPNYRIEDLGAASRQRIQAGCSQTFQCFLNRNPEDSFGEVTSLDSCKGFNMKVRIDGTDAGQELQVPISRQSWMKSADHVNLGDPLRLCRLDSSNDLVDRHFKSVGVAFPRPKSAELAGEHADVGVIDVSVQNVSCAIPVFPVPNDVGYLAEGVHIGRTKEGTGFGFVDSLPIDHFFIDVFERIRDESPICEIFHKINLTQMQSPSKLAPAFDISPATLGFAEG